MAKKPPKPVHRVEYHVEDRPVWSDGLLWDAHEDRQKASAQINAELDRLEAEVDALWNDVKALEAELEEAQEDAEQAIRDLDTLWEGCQAHDTGSRLAWISRRDD